jgi:hypothetical protein
MRGTDADQGGLFSYVSMEQRIPPTHPLRRIRALLDEALGSISRWWRRSARFIKRSGSKSLRHVELLCRHSGITKTVTSNTIERGQELIQSSRRKVSIRLNSRVLWVTRMTSNAAA